MSEDEILQPAAQEAVDCAMRESSPTETYRVLAVCTNCHTKGEIVIPRGVSVARYGCPTCRVSALRSLPR